MFRGFVALCVPALVLPVACAPESGPTQNGAPQTYSVTITYPDGKPLQSLILYAQQFLSPDSNQALLAVSPSPALSSTPAVTWSTDAPGVVSFSQSPLNCFGCPAAPAGQTYVTMSNSTLGVAHVTATVGSPVNASATITVWTYGSLALSCAFRYVPAMSFDPGSTASGLSSDLYVTQAANAGYPLDPCDNSVFTTGVAAVHFPYGGVLVPGSWQTFPQVSASQWSDATQQAPLSAATGEILLFKTKRGRVVKALLPLGPYEVGSDSAFPY